MKYANYLILFILLGAGVLLKDYVHVSTNLLSLFASKESVEKLNVANNLGYSKEMLIAIKGLNKESKKEVRSLSKKLQTLQDVEFVQSSVIPTEEIQEYYKKYYPLLAAFDGSERTRESIREKLRSLYDAQSSSVFYSSVNKNDPLALFNLEIVKGSSASRKGDLITLGDYGYLIRVMTKVTPSQMNEAKALYDDVKFILKGYPDAVAFAPFFYTVENSAKIQADVQWIVALSTIVLLFIYALLLKNVKLLSQTLVALFSSMVFASLLSTTLFTNFNVLSLAFGMSLTAVSVDYLLHYHFHHFYQSTGRVDKNVLYGFLTTLAAFGIFSFIPIPLIAQISFFSVLSLSFAYGLFTFVFPKLEIKKYEEPFRGSLPRERKKVQAIVFFALSLALFAYAAMNFKLDANLRNLDYHNVNLQNAEQLFKQNSGAKLVPVIVQATSEDELMSELTALREKTPDSFSFASFVLDNKSCLDKQKELQSYDFKRLREFVNEEASSIGFRSGYFEDAYRFAEQTPECQTPNLDIFKSYGLSAFNDEKKYYSIALASDAKEAQKFAFVESIDVKEMFDKAAQEMYENLLLFGSVVLSVIFALLFVSVKRRFLYALNYVLFPISFVLASLVTFSAVNVMHLFSLIILVAIGIDYGIYMSNSDKPRNTMLAIKYSLLSTFAAFGVLVFSSIVALNSIGLVITLGCAAIFILIKAMK